jgi:hypothetical protein
LTDRTFDFRPDFRPGDIGRLAYALRQLGVDDTVTVVVNRTDAHEADPVLAELEEGGFDVFTKGGHGDEFSIVARRRH